MHIVTRCPQGLDVHQGHLKNMKTTTLVANNSMIDYELKNIDPEDIEDFLIKVETSFDIKFVGDELVHITTFRQLCDHIANKIQLEHSDDCTSQQAFYKLRDAIISTSQVDHKKTISTDSPLAGLFPRHNRRSQTKKLEAHLGFKLNIIRPPHWATGTLAIMILAATVGLFFYWQIGLAGLAFSIVGLWIANKFGNELDLETVGQVAEKMTSAHYLKSRRDMNTFNKNEIENVLVGLFSNYFDIDNGIHPKTNLERRI